MSASLIEYYIKQQSVKQIRDKGLALFFDKKVGDLEFDDGAGKIETDVEGVGGLYHVVVSNHTNMNIKAECTCPYNHGGICKHSVAVLYKILATVYPKKQLPPKGEKIVVENRNSSSPRKIPDFEKLNTLTLSKYYRPVNRFYSYINLVVKNIFLIDNGLLFRVADGANYHSYEYVVKVFKEKRDYLTVCSCSKMTTGICVHQHEVLRIIYAKGRQVLEFFQPDFSNAYYRKAARLHQIPEKFANPEHISLTVNKSFNIEIQLKGELEKLVLKPKISEGFLAGFKSKIKFDKTMLKESYAAAANSSKAIGYVFQFRVLADSFRLTQIMLTTPYQICCRSNAQYLGKISFHLLR